MSDQVILDFIKIIEMTLESPMSDTQRVLLLKDLCEKYKSRIMEEEDIK